MKAKNSLYIYPVTNKLSVTNIYGILPRIPEGYEQIDFRPPKKGDVFITKNDTLALTNTFITEVAVDDFPISDPRVIVARQKQSFKGMCCVVYFSDIYGEDDIQIPEGYEFKAFRVPKLGEYIIAIGGVLVQYTFGIILSPRIIVEPKS